MAECENVPDGMPSPLYYAICSKAVHICFLASLTQPASCRLSSGKGCEESHEGVVPICCFLYLLCAKGPAAGLDKGQAVDSIDTEVQAAASTQVFSSSSHNTEKLPRAACHQLSDTVWTYCQKVGNSLH